MKHQYKDFYFEVINNRDQLQATFARRWQAEKFAEEYGFKVVKVDVTATIHTVIPYDNEYCYSVVVKEEEKEKATGIINDAYTKWLTDDKAGDFQEYAEKMLAAQDIKVEFSIWKED